jgi:alkanesulfonate monooxygenase SsuD/methylene tetrahydromethanopterin reductase-like flavin-dependent oxidoreductase (luciferase family)
MARIAARYADLWNGAWVASPNDEVLTARMAELDRACEEVGRAPAEIARTAGVSVRYDDAELPGPTGNREKDIMGDPSAVAAHLAAFRDAGYSEVMVWLEPMDERSIDRLAEAVARLHG